MKDITTIGIDIAKNFLQIHGEDSKGKPVLKKRISRDKFLVFMSNIPKCLVGMEACGGAHYWGRKLLDLGFDVKLMSPRKVKKFVENNKNDANDAAACAVAVRRGDMVFVAIKTQTQLDVQAIHRIRSQYIKQKTALMNMIRGLFLEVGIGIPKGKAALVREIGVLLNDETDDRLTETMKNMLHHLYKSLTQLDEEITRYKASLEKLAKEDKNCKKLLDIPGIGPISATAVISKIGNASEFKNGRELSAYLGLVPKQYSSGDKQILGGISKHGDRYIRQLLIHGGRSALKSAMKHDKNTGLPEKQDEHSNWMRKLAERVGINKASVAIANKNARIIVGLFKNQTTFQAKSAHN